jgi:hypothetical protein
LSKKAACRCSSAIDRFDGHQDAHLRRDLNHAGNKQAALEFLEGRENVKMSACPRAGLRTWFNLPQEPMAD